MANEDKATRYHRLRRRASAAGTATAAAFLILILVSGASTRLRDLMAAFTGESFSLLIVTYVAVLVLVAECLQLPFAYYQGVTLERRYGLAAGSRWRWWTDRIKATGLGLAVAAGAALILYTLIRWTPEYWWIASAAAFTVLLVLLAQLAPVVLMPLFYHLERLDRPELVARLVALARRANADVLGVFEWRLSDRTRKANAALAGMGRTRRILLSDTLLADHSDDEIEVILAHELAHHVHRDIWSTVALEALLITAGFFIADRALLAAADWLGLMGKADVAGLPLLIVTAGAVSLLMLPVANAVSRRHERRADAYALDMTGKRDAFVAAMRKLAARNLAEDQPSRLVEVLFHSHPSTSARIAAARRWKSKSAADGLV